MPKCKSGLHEWINPESAKKCCNGYKRVVIIYPNPEEVEDFYGWYGYKWVKE